MSLKPKSNDPPDRDPLLTVPEAAARCRLSVRSMWRHIKSGALKVVRLGSSVRIRQSDLDAFIIKHLK
jgi:excisionase family DNA binding protein